MSASSHTPTPGPPRPAAVHLLTAKLKRPYGKLKGADVFSAEAQAILNHATDSDWAAAQEKADQEELKWKQHVEMEAAAPGSCCCSLEAATCK